MLRESRCRSGIAGKSAIVWSLALVLAGFAGMSPVGNLEADDPPQGVKSPPVTEKQVLDARARGIKYLKEKIQSQQDPGYRFVAALALLKADVSAETPEIRETIDVILASCKGGKYVPGPRHLYEASVALMCLANADREKYKPQIEMIAIYILSQQNDSGSFDYPVGVKGRAFGDNSITQFALLSLWEARRSGVKIPGSVWDRCAQWLMKSNNSDGGYPYHPEEGSHPSIHTMCAAAAGSMLIIRHQLFPQLRVPFTKEGVPTDVASNRRFGVLQTNVGEEGYQPTFEVGHMDEKIKGTIGWLISHYKVDPEFNWAIYYLYAVERFCALGYMPQVGDHDWYREGAAFLVARQMQDGAWSDDLVEKGRNDFWTVSATSLAVMFLSKATAKMVEPPIGTGLLIGGRGLPENLKDVQFNAGKAKEQKSLGSMDDLLIELEKPDSDKIASAQADIIDKILQERPDDLVKHKDRLVKLAEDPRPEVRQTVMWALGRTNDLRVCKTLIESLKDPSEDVAIEASISLRILSRQLRGVGLADEEFKPAAEYNAWTAWYRSIRPYEERDDLLREAK